MPCCQVFEPGVQSGHRLASLGFSEEQNMHTETREGSRYNCCWVKECLPITSMAGATMFSVIQKKTFTYSIHPGKTIEKVGSVKSESVTGKVLVINGSHMSVFNKKALPFTARCHPRYQSVSSSVVQHHATIWCDSFSNPYFHWRYSGQLILKFFVSKYLLMDRFADF